MACAYNGIARQLSIIFQLQTTRHMAAWARCCMGQKKQFAGSFDVIGVLLAAGQSIG